MAVNVLIYLNNKPLHVWYSHALCWLAAASSQST